MLEAFLYILVAALCLFVATVAWFYWAIRHLDDQGEEILDDD